MVDQAAVTIVAHIRPDALPDLSALLGHIGADPAENDVIAFGRIWGVHYARLVLLEPSRDLRGQPIPPALAFLTDVDGSAGQYFHNLVDLAGAGVDRVFAHCEGYPAAGARTRDTRLAYLQRHQVPTGAAYVNTRGRTVQQIRQEAALREAIQGFLDHTRSEWTGADPRVVRAAVRDFVARDGALRWARSPIRPDLLTRVREALHLAAGVLVLLLLLPWALLALPVFAVVLRLHELTDEPDQERPAEAHIQELAALEDHVVQNQFTVLGLVKPGPFRQLTTRTVLWLANFTVRHVFNRSNLAGVKTIHFARWVFLDGGRRLIFASNYDGTLESYMDDFIDKVAWGLNATFSNGVGYPRTNWLVKDGARDEVAFKAILRRRQIPTQVWYAAYPQLTALNIENNARLREGLSGSMGAAEAAAWLRRL